MLRKVGNLGDLVKTSKGHVDCYISTDESEMEDILGYLGFKDISGHHLPKVEESQLAHSYRKLYGMCGNVYRHQVTGLKVECVDVPLEEAQRMQPEIGFMSMSKIRVHTNGSVNSEKMILPIMKALGEERQNVAFVNDAGSSVHVKLSEFYC